MLKLGLELIFDIIKKNKNPDQPPSEPNIKVSEGEEKNLTGPSRYFSDN